MDGYAPLGGRLKAVVIVFTLITLTWILSAVFGALDVALLNRVIAGEAVSNAEWIATDERIAVIGYVQGAGYLAGAIAFIVWLYRAYHNLDAVAPDKRRFGHGWAIGGWFVPIMALWRPKQIVNDVWRGGGSSQASVVAWFWWAAWVAMFVVRFVGGDDYRTSEDPVEVRDAAVALLVTDVLGIIAAPLAIVIAVRSTKRLDERAAAQSRPTEPDWRLFPPPAESEPSEPPERRPGDQFPAYPG